MDTSQQHRASLQSDWHALVRANVVAVSQWVLHGRTTGILWPADSNHLEKLDTVGQARGDNDNILAPGGDLV